MENPQINMKSFYMYDFSSYTPSDLNFFKLL